MLGLGLLLGFLLGVSSTLKSSLATALRLLPNHHCLYCCDAIPSHPRVDVHRCVFFLSNDVTNNLFVIFVSVAHGDPGLRFRRSFHRRGLSGSAPGRSRGWRGPAFDRSYSCTRVLQSYSRRLFFFCFLRSNEGTKTGLCLLSFLLRSLRLTKTVLKPKKKRPRKRSSRLSGGRGVSEFFQSEKQRSLGDQRHRSDGLR